MNWKTIFKLTKTKIIYFIILTLISQVYILWQVTHPVCTGPCGDKVYTYAWQFQTWGIYTLLFSIFFILTVFVVSFFYNLIYTDFYNKKTYK